jgi:hypothetical protein
MSLSALCFQPTRRGRKRLLATNFVSHPRGAVHLPETKIQAIYRENAMPITMQRLVLTREKPPAQEQGETGKKQGAEQWKQAKIQGM